MGIGGARKVGAVSQRQGEFVVPVTVRGGARDRLCSGLDWRWFRCLFEAEDFAGEVDGDVVAVDELAF